ncbi:MAG TPA: FtsX-like permease family protein [Candidatus Thermoplasmatota archaeon]|jgi:putative ABC transport system permease protein|nr:FtsX-like permease family protein [Candidatus Thermoplasmatota archaeon]
MDAVGWAVVGVAALLLAGVAWSALRRPILLRMALRNLQRRRSQAMAIAFGLMIGTAIIAGSLATGDSTTYAVRDSALQAFGPLDETVGIEGRLYFPQSVVAQLEDHPRVRAATDGVAPILLEDVAIGNPRAAQWEPRAALVGLDPGRDARFGPYRVAGGTTTLQGLGEDDVILNQRLAESLQAKAGDTVTLRYAQRPDPLVPKLFTFNGTIAAGAGSPVPLPIALPVSPYTSTPADEATFPFPADHGAARITAVLLWGDAGNRTDLDLALETPSGTATWNSNGTLNAPDVPATLNATAEEGQWTLRVASKAAVAQRFTALVLVFYEIHDIALLQEFLDQLRAQPEAQEFLDQITGGLRLESRDMTVRAVALEPGRGSFLNAPDVFVRLDVAQAMLGKQDKINLVMVSNPGDAEQGLAGTAPAMAALDAAVLDVRTQAGDDSLDGLRARPLKQEWVTEAERAGSLFSSFLAMMGSFSILAGLILIGNIFVMLTEERRAELGVARALGLTRGEVTRLFAYEGAAYAVVASAMGVLLGLLVSWLFIAGFNASWGEAIELALPFRPSLDSLLLAFAAGVVMTLGAIMAASQRAARLNIVRSIRRLEEPDTPLGRGTFLAGAALLAISLPLTAWGFAGGTFTLRIVPPNLAILGGALVAARFLHRSDATKLAGLAMLAFNLWTVFAFETPATREGMLVSPARGVLMVLGAVLLLVQSRWLLAGAQGLLSRVRGLRPIARTALAYPLHKKLRTGLTVLMFGLVVTMVVFFSIFFTMFTPLLVNQTGSFDVRADTTVPVDDFAARLGAAQAGEPLLAGVASTTTLEYAEVWGGKLLTIGGEPVRYHGAPVDYVYGVGPDFAGAQDFPMLEILPRFASSRDIFDAMQRDATLIVISQLYTIGDTGRPGTHHVGDTLTMKMRSGTQNFTIAGIQRQVYFAGVFVSQPVLEANFDALHGMHLLKLRGGADTVAVAAAVERSQQDLGADAASTSVEAQTLIDQQSRVYGLFEVYLGLGLVLGVASLGLITARSVLERRQEVGMLRAIGMPAKLVFRSFVVEALFIVTLGAVVGVFIGVLVAYGVTTTMLNGLGFDFRVPWDSIALMLLAAYAATLAAVLAPARRAAKLAPAEAIRYIE